MLPRSAWPTSQRSCLVSAAQPHLHIKAAGRLRQGKGSRFPPVPYEMLKLTELVAFSWYCLCSQNWSWKRVYL